MAPFVGENDPGWFVCREETEAPHTADIPGAEPPFGCPCCEEQEPGITDPFGVPDSLADRAAHEWALVQKHTARLWRAVAAMHEHVSRTRGAAAAEHVGAEVALLTNTHPRTGMSLLITSIKASRELPELAELVQSGQLSAKHVEALLDELARWTDSPQQAREVLALTLARCKERAAHQGWPTPGVAPTAAYRGDPARSACCGQAPQERRGATRCAAQPGRGRRGVDQHQRAGGAADAGLRGDPGPGRGAGSAAR